MKVVHFFEYLHLYLLKFCNWLQLYFFAYKNNITFAACKISDLYYQVCNARMSIHFCLDYEKYSMMSEDKMAILSTKKYFIENALLYYNFAVDYLWQVLWFYYNNCGMGLLWRY